MAVIGYFIYFASIYNDVTLSKEFQSTAPHHFFSNLASIIRHTLVNFPHWTIILKNHIKLIDANVFLAFLLYRLSFQRTMKVLVIQSYKRLLLVLKNMLSVCRV